MKISPDIFFIFSKFWFSDLLGSKRAKINPKWQKNFVCRTIYLRNYVSYNCHLLCTYVKWSYLPVLFPFFFYFYFWFFRLLGGSNGKKWPQLTKTSPCHTLHLRNYQSYDLNLCHTCIKDDIYRSFSYFFQILIFEVASRVKGQKLA